jgi:hypothetical protein
MGIILIDKEDIGIISRKMTIAGSVKNIYATNCDSKNIKEQIFITKVKPNLLLSFVENMTKHAIGITVAISILELVPSDTFYP